MAKKANNSNLPFISVVMPCFNGATFISKAIDSVINQDYPNFELYVKDGGSSDNTVEIIKSYAKKFPSKIKWVSQKDKGQTDAINFGLKKVSGDILAYLNADDIYKPGAFKTVGEYFSKNKDSLWAIGKCDIIDEKGRVIRSQITTYKNFWLDMYSYNTLLVLNYISQMGVFWRREALKKIGYFDSNQYYVMDYEYWLRLGKISPPGIIPDYLASFRIVSSSKSSTGFIKQFEDEYQAAKKYTDNKFLLNLHSLHIKIITSVYNLMKLVAS